MCDMCDDPNLTASDYRRRLAAIIEETGWAILFVEPDGNQPSLSYTVGLTGFGLPELVTHGLGVACARELNKLARDCVDGLLRAGSTTEIWGEPYQLVPQRNAGELLAAVGFYGSAVRVLRLRPVRR